MSGTCTSVVDIVFVFYYSFYVLRLLDNDSHFKIAYYINVEPLVNQLLYGMDFCL